MTMQTRTNICPSPCPALTDLSGGGLWSLGSSVTAVVGPSPSLGSATIGGTVYGPVLLDSWDGQLRTPRKPLRTSWVNGTNGNLLLSMPTFAASAYVGGYVTIALMTRVVTSTAGTTPYVRLRLVVNGLVKITTVAYTVTIGNWQLVWGQALMTGAWLDGSNNSQFNVQVSPVGTTTTFSIDVDNMFIELNAPRETSPFGPVMFASDGPGVWWNGLPFSSTSSMKYDVDPLHGAHPTQQLPLMFARADAQPIQTLDFVSDSSSHGIGSGYYTPSLRWTPLPNLTEFHSRRGRNDVGSAQNTGQATLTFDNTDGTYDIENPASSFYAATGVSELRYGKLVQVATVESSRGYFYTHVMFTGRFQLITTKESQNNSVADMSVFDDWNVVTNQTVPTYLGYVRSTESAITRQGWLSAFVSGVNYNIGRNDAAFANNAYFSLLYLDTWKNDIYHLQNLLYGSYWWPTFPSIQYAMLPTKGGGTVADGLQEVSDMLAGYHEQIYVDVNGYITMGYVPLHAKEQGTSGAYQPYAGRLHPAPVLADGTVAYDNRNGTYSAIGTPANYEVFEYEEVDFALLDTLASITIDRGPEWAAPYLPSSEGMGVSYDYHAGIAWPIPTFGTPPADPVESYTQTFPLSDQGGNGVQLTRNLPTWDWVTLPATFLPNDILHRQPASYRPTKRYASTVKINLTGQFNSLVTGETYTGNGQTITTQWSKLGVLLSTDILDRMTVQRKSQYSANPFTYTACVYGIDVDYVAEQGELMLTLHTYDGGL